jgi:soluble lytic murein transglycosylase
MMHTYQRAVFFFLGMVLAASCVLPSSADTPVLPHESDPSATVSFTVAAPSPADTPTPANAFTATPAPDDRLKLGDRAMLQGDYAAAQTQYRDALAAGVQPDRAAFFLARAQFDGGDPAGARATLQNLLTAQPAGDYALRARFLLGETAAAQEDWHAAAAAYQDFLANAPGLLDALVEERLGDTFSAAGNYDLAVQSYDAAANAAAPAESLGLLEKEADAFQDAKLPEPALALYERVLASVTSDRASARLNRKIGGILIALGRTEEGYERYRTALLYPLFDDAYLCLRDLLAAGDTVDGLVRGIIDYNYGENEVAVQVLTDYLAANPADTGKALYYRGLAYQSLDNAQSAVADFDAAAAVGPDTGVWDQALFESAYTRWYSLDDFTGGASVLAGLADSAPAHPRAAEALNGAARIAERGGELARAAQLWNRVAEDYPASEYAADARHFAGIALYRARDYAGAETLFAKQTGAGDVYVRSRAWFWTGKARAARGDNSAAQEAFTQAAEADPTGYYSERARDLQAGRQAFSSTGSLNIAFDLDAEFRAAEAWVQQQFPLATPVPLENRYAAARNDPRLLRGRLLWDLGLYDDAQVEFTSLRTILAGDPAASLFLSRYLLDLGYYPGAIFAARQVLNAANMNDAQTLTAPAYFSHVRFGPYFAELLVPQAGKYGFDPLLLFSLVRQESLFGVTAVSSASAHGLMQLIPSTAEYMAGKLGLGDLSQRDLYRPFINIQLGTGYLAEQRDDFDGNLYLALAAYNAGPTAATWRDLAGGDDDLLVEVIRYAETRDYVRGIYELYDIYRDIYGG